MKRITIQVPEDLYAKWKAWLADKGLKDSEVYEFFMWWTVEQSDGRKIDHFWRRDDQDQG